MSDTKATLKRLRTEREAQVKAAQAASKVVRTERKKISAEMESGPKSVPQIAAAVDMSTDRVLWHIAAMRKYGELAEAAEKDGDYFTYELVTEEKADDAASDEAAEAGTADESAGGAAETATDTAPQTDAGEEG